MGFFSSTPPTNPTSELKFKEYMKELTKQNN
jgi:hypothetical protein